MLPCAIPILVAALAGCGAAGQIRGRVVAGAGTGVHGAIARLREGGASGGATARGPDPESARVRSLIALGKPVYCAARRGDEVALTFDDGPGPYTRLVLDKLRKHGIRATFFDVGRNIALMPTAPRREQALGGVGDHTFTHPVLTSLPAAGAHRELAGAQLALERSSGAPVFLFRPPYGVHDASIDALARALGLLEVMWSVDSADSLGASHAQIARNVIAGMRGGAIILMHENHGQTVRALLPIFAALARRHLHAVSVAQLLTDDPPSPQQLRAGQRGCGTVAQARTGD